MGQGLADLEEAREEVVAEVLNAPKRRVDNEVSRLSDSVYILQMHCKIIEDVSKKYRSALFRSRVTLASTAISTVVLPSAALLIIALFPTFGAASGLASSYVLGYPIFVALGGTVGTYECHVRIAS